MKILRFHEKHGDRVFLFKTKEEYQLILAQVAQERLDEGYWYDTENGSDQIDRLWPMRHLSDAGHIALLLKRLQDPLERPNTNPTSYYLHQVAQWMRARRDYEYEGWDVLPVEQCQLTHYEGSVRRTSSAT
jgi:hypothetical protein